MLGSYKKIDAGWTWNLIRRDRLIEDKSRIRNSYLCLAASNMNQLIFVELQFVQTIVQQSISGADITSYAFYGASREAHGKLTNSKIQ